MSNSLVVVVDSSLENERKETALAHKFFHLSCCRRSGTYKFHEEFPHLIQAKPSEAFESRLIKLSQQVH